VDLIALQFGVLQVRGGDDDPSGGVYLYRHLVALFRRVSEDFVQHPDYVLEAVIVVVEQNNVVGW
jgi:hypothetical protein